MRPAHREQQQPRPEAGLYGVAEGKRWSTYREDKKPAVRLSKALAIGV